MATKIIPASQVKVTSPEKGTVATRNTITGAFTGRRAISGRGDTTRARHARRDIDIDHDGDIDIPAGGIVGRSKSIRVKASSGRRMHRRSL